MSAWLLSTRLTLVYVGACAEWKTPCSWIFLLFVHPDSKKIKISVIPGTGRSLLSTEWKTTTKPRIPRKIQKTDKRQGVLQPPNSPNSGWKDQKTQVIYFLLSDSPTVTIFLVSLFILIMSASQQEAYDRGSPSRLVVMEDHPAYGIQVAPDHSQPKYVNLLQLLPYR